MISSRLLLLISLYSVQAIPCGIASFVEIVLTGARLPYASLAFFGLHSWPYSLRVLWAPVVEVWRNKYSSNSDTKSNLFGSRLLGRWDSWAFLSQCGISVALCLGGLSFGLSEKKFDISNSESESGSSSAAAASLESDKFLLTLTASFALVRFSTAIQDIVMDAWSLEVLGDHRSQQGLAQAVGAALGWMVGANMHKVMEVMILLPGLSFLFGDAIPGERPQLGMYLFFCAGCVMVINLVMLTGFRIKCRGDEHASVEKSGVELKNVNTAAAAKDQSRSISEQFSLAFADSRLQSVAFMLVFWWFPFVSVDEVARVTLQQSCDIPADDLISVGSILSPWNMFVPVLVTWMFSMQNVKQNQSFPDVKFRRIQVKPLSSFCQPFYLPRLVLCFMNGVFTLVWMRNEELCEGLTTDPSGYARGIFYSWSLCSGILSIFMSTGFFTTQMAYFAESAPTQTTGSDSTKVGPATWMQVCGSLHTLGGFWVVPVGLWMMERIEMLIKTLMTLNLQKQDESALAFSVFMGFSLLSGVVLYYGRFRRIIADLEGEPKKML